MNLKKYLGPALALILVIGVIVIALRLISGAVSLAGGVLNTVLGIVLILALAAIVIWMFGYASKKRKK